MAKLYILIYIIIITGRYQAMAMAKIKSMNFKNINQLQLFFAKMSELSIALMKDNCNASIVQN